MDLVNFKNEMNIMIYIGVYLFIYLLFIYQNVGVFGIKCNFWAVTVGGHCCSIYIYVFKVLKLSEVFRVSFINIIN